MNDRIASFPGRHLIAIQTVFLRKDLTGRADLCCKCVTPIPSLCRMGNRDTRGASIYRISKSRNFAPVQVSTSLCNIKDIPKLDILRLNLLVQLILFILFVFQCCTFSRNIFLESLCTYRSFSFSYVPVSAIANNSESLGLYLGPRRTLLQ